MCEVWGLLGQRQERKREKCVCERVPCRVRVECVLCWCGMCCVCVCVCVCGVLCGAVSEECKVELPGQRRVNEGECGWGEEHGAMHHQERERGGREREEAERRAKKKSPQVLTQRFLLFFFFFSCLFALLSRSSLDTRFIASILTASFTQTLSFTTRCLFLAARR